MIRRILLAILCLVLLQSQTRLFDIVQYEAALPLSDDMLSQIENAGRGVVSSAISVRKGTTWLSFGENSAEAAWYMCTGNMMEQNGYRLTEGHWPMAGLGDEKHIAVHIDIAQAFIADPSLLIGEKVELNGAEHTVDGLFLHENSPLTQLEKAAVVTPYDGEFEIGVIEFSFRAGESALYREFIANIIGAMSVNDIDAMARTNACLLAFSLILLTFAPAKTACTWLRVRWRDLCSGMKLVKNELYWRECAKLHARDMLILTSLTVAIAAPLAAAYIWLLRFFYIPLGLLPDNLRSISLIVETVREYAIAQNNDPGAATALLARVKTVRVFALLLPGFYCVKIRKRS